MSALLNVSQNYHIAGGSDSYFFALEGLMRRRGVSVVPYCAQSHKNIESEWSDYFPRAADFENPSAVDAFRFVYSFEAKKGLERLLDRVDIRLAHLHIYYGKLTGSIIPTLRRRGIPIVQTLHEYRHICPISTCVRDGVACELCGHGKFWNALRYRCNRNSISRSGLSMLESYVGRASGGIRDVDKFIAVSNFCASRMIENGIPAEKLEVVHNFVDTDQITPDYTPGSYFLYFGRLERIKGIETLLRAMKKVPDINLVLAGDGGYAVEAKALAKSLALENVKFAGFKGGNELAGLIKGAIATVVPSEWYENCPMSILESFAYGKVVIGSNIGGIPELIADDSCGAVFEPGCAEKLAAAMEELWRKPRSMLDEMARSAREVVEGRFSAKAHFTAVSSIYQKLGYQL